MIRDFLITFRRDKDGKVQLVLYPDRLKSTEVRTMKTPRDIFNLEVEQRMPPPAYIPFEASRLGELRDNDEDDGRWIVQSAGDRVSQWLLGEDVKETLAGILSALPEDQKLRLIFTADKSMRELFDPTQVPVELIRPEEDHTPYSVSLRVSSVIHLLPEGGSGGPPGNSLDWPLRFLIVRSNPSDLGLAVPPAIPVRDEILRLGAHFGPGAVVIDILSSEPGINKSATWSAFTTQMKDNDPYNIVIYLGHGSVKEEDGSSCLQFEDGAGHQDVAQYDLISPFQGNPVPVVLLVACLTAEQVTEERFKVLHQRKMSEWLRGSRGVAQALISSLETRTQLVVGMRYRLDVGDATLFLNSFFDSLLRVTRGNVEAGVHLARRTLQQHSKFPAAFSSPVVFRRLRPDATEDEPLLSFIAQKTYVPTTCNGPAGDWQIPRKVIWNNLISTGWTERTDKKPYLDVLGAIEKELIQNAIVNNPLILPEPVVILPEESASFAVRLHGSLGPEKIEKLSGLLVFDRDDILIEKVTPSDELRAKGYKAPTDTIGRVVDFSIQPAGSVQPLENVILFTVKVKVGKEFPLLSPVIISTLQSVPPKIICPGTNMIIVPPR
jgi:hypothetical protein